MKMEALMQASKKNSWSGNEVGFRSSAENGGGGRSEARSTPSLS
jgi:hypothetical protein